MVPLFYDRPTADKLPRAWIKRMKSSIASNAVRYNTVRMVREYAERFYVPAARLAEKVTANQPSRMLRLMAPFAAAFIPLVPEASIGRRGVLSHTSTPETIARAMRMS